MPDRLYTKEQTKTRKVRESKISGEHERGTSEKEGEEGMRRGGGRGGGGRDWGRRRYIHILKWERVTIIKRGHWEEGAYMNVRERERECCIITSMFCIFVRMGMRI